MREEWLKTLPKRQTLWHRICYGNHIDILHEALTLDFCIFIQGELIFSQSLNFSALLCFIDSKTSFLYHILALTYRNQ